MEKNKTKVTTKERQDLIPLLKEAQQRCGYLSPEVLKELADSVGMPLSEVYGVASFYSFLSVKPQGRNVIRICKSLPCYLKNYPLMVESIKKEIGIGPGETTPDKRFSLELTNCIGACDQAPAMLVNDDVHGNLTPDKISQILKVYP